MFNEDELDAICLFVKGKNKGEALNGDDILQINSALRSFNDEVIDYEDWTNIINRAGIINDDDNYDNLTEFEEYYQNCLSVEENITLFFEWIAEDDEE